MMPKTKNNNKNPNFPQPIVGKNQQALEIYLTTYKCLLEAP
jgi:hypothetical protein